MAPAFEAFRRSARNAGAEMVRVGGRVKRMIWDNILSKGVNANRVLCMYDSDNELAISVFSLIRIP